MIKVVKFGGSSVANATQFQKVKDIVCKEKERKYIIVSACGKESFEDYKVTDLLYLCEAHIRYHVSYESLFTLVEDKYKRIKKELDLQIDLEKEFNVIKTAMDKGNITTDFLVSRGEYLTAKCMAEYIGADFVDAADIIVFDYDGEVNFEETKKRIQKIKTKNKIVIPGFYGALPNGMVKVMSRGGSDVSGSVIANVVDADMYENWTDVSGVLVADPRIIHHPMRIDYITYSELRGMSYMGANVLHDHAIFAVRQKGIPINIRNTNEPDNPGTIIVDHIDKKKDKPLAVTGIVGKRDFSIITLTKNHSSAEIGFLRKVLSIFEVYKVSIESVPITVDTFSLIIKAEAIEHYIYEIIGRIKEDIRPDEIILQEHVSLIAVVGRGMQAVPGMSGRLLSEFGRNEINIKVINQTADELCIVVGVENKDFEKAIQCIYDRFVVEEGRK
ncbi:MAG: aspartate kinase [Solobacterium sp.]|nr:aspartate kinase [Solobacterium sp.]